VILAGFSFLGKRMPLFTICQWPGCRNPAPYGERFCSAHKKRGEARVAQYKAEREKAREARRCKRTGSSAKRGYGYRWQRLRAAFLREHPLCEACLLQGRATPATDVDHIKPHRGDQDLMWDVDNLQALCHACHSKKTAREDGGFGNAARLDKDQRSS
jgi:5-methylcytosine-specific restriction protein A